MFRLIAALSFLLISANVSYSKPDKEKEAEFFAGVMLLQQQMEVKSGEKAKKFRELEVMTGISAAEAKRILAQYREKPVEWQKLYGEMLKLLNETNIKFQKTDSMRTAAIDTSKKVSQKRPTRVTKPLPVSKIKH